MIYIKKTYLLDTNILLHTPQAILTFKEHDVVLPIGGIEELTHKASKGNNELGVNAREALKNISKYLDRPLPDGGRLFLLPIDEFDTKKIPTILKCFSKAKENFVNPIIISNDDTVKIYAKMLGYPYEPYLHTRVAPVVEQYQGRKEIYLPQDFITELFENNSIAQEKFEKFLDNPLTENEFLVIHNANEPKQTALGMYRKNHIYPLSKDITKVYGIKPKNVGQQFALAALLAPVEEIPMVILKGPAGTAKTFLSLAAGLEQTLNRNKYDKILISRPNVKFDEDIGFLKGAEEEKIGPLMRPAIDNLEQLCRLKEHDKNDTRHKGNYVQELFDRGTIVAQAMAYMRGRSIANSFILMDEFQNATPNQALGIASRCGINSKLVLVGDVKQIDNRELDSTNNGLSFASEAMKGSPLCAQVVFTDEECVRSPLSLDVINRMNRK